jgi:hypothetical protein
VNFKKFLISILVFFFVIIAGYIFSAMTKNSTEEYFDSKAQITVLPFVHSYVLKIDGVSPQSKLNDCPSTSLVSKGYIIPLLNYKIIDNTTYVPYKNFCI